VSVVTVQRHRQKFFLVTQALLIALLLSYPATVLSQITRLRVGTNAPASTESVLFSMASKAGILKQYQLDVEIIYIAGGTLAMQALVGKSLVFSAPVGRRLSWHIWKAHRQKSLAACTTDCLTRSLRAGQSQLPDN